VTPEERIAALERAAWRDRVFALGAIALFLGTAQVSAPPAPLLVRAASGESARIDAAGLTVRDAAGVVRADAGIDRDKNPSVDEYDAAGTIRQAIYLLSDRPVLRQFDKTGKRRDELFLASDTENGEMVVRDANDVNRLAAFIGDKNLPEVAFYGSDALVRAYLASDDSGAYLVMNDGKKTTRATVGQYTDGTFGLDVRNTAGTTVFKAP
jgi:hypothetical protein